jgi:thiol-disulfide isomerase/thioredoxin
MKKLFGLMMAAAIIYSCSGPGTKNFNFSVNGTLEGDYSGKAYLYKRESGEWIKLDSVQVENNAFRFEGNIDLPELYYISIDAENRYASFFAEQSEIGFTANVSDFGNPVVTGSLSQDEYNAFNVEVEVYNDELGRIWTEIKAARDAGNAEAQAALDAEFDETDARLKAFILDNAMKKNSSVVAAYAVLRNAYYYDENDLEPVVANFDPSIASSVYVEKLTERVNILKSVAVGQPAIDFTMNDPDGNPVQLSSLFGKYLLVDFWASWCGPCRQENPNVVAAYSNYNEKGFDILGVSFDESKDKWLEAVQVDSLTWHHVSDLKGWGNEAGKLYAVNSIPANILLDPQGKIIAKNLRGEDLRSKLAELLGE